MWEKRLHCGLWKDTQPLTWYSMVRASDTLKDAGGGNLFLICGVGLFLAPFIFALHRNIEKRELLALVNLSLFL